MHASEQTGEVAYILVTHRERDFRNAQITVFEQVACLTDANFLQVFDGRFVGSLPKAAIE
jgi:hypothetical protein